MNEMTAPADRAEITRTPEMIGAEIREIQRQCRAMTVLYAVEAGRRLREAKELVQHGEWSDWVKRETGMSMSSASRLMKLYDEYASDQIGILGAETKSSTLQNLSVSNALRLLAIPEEEREAFAEEHDVQHLSARQLDELLEARKKAEFERDRALDRAERAEERAEQLLLGRNEYEEELHQTASKMADAQDEARHARLELEAAKKRVQELESRPVEVAVQVDESAVQKAAEDAKAEAKKKIERLEKKLAAAEKKREKAEQDAKAAADKLQSAGSDAAAERDRLAQELESVKRQLKMADTGTAQFKVLFDGVQSDLNDMLRLLRAAEGDARESMRRAARALLQKFGEELGT